MVRMAIVNTSINVRCQSLRLFNVSRSQPSLSCSESYKNSIWQRVTGEIYLESLQIVTIVSFASFKIAKLGTQEMHQEKKTQRNSCGIQSSSAINSLVIWAQQRNAMTANRYNFNLLLCASKTQALYFYFLSYFWTVICQIHRVATFRKPARSSWKFLFDFRLTLHLYYKIKPNIYWNKYIMHNVEL